MSTLVDIPTVADRLGVTERFVQRLIHERRIPYLKIGKYVRFDPDTVAAWVDERRVDPLEFSGDRSRGPWATAGGRETEPSSAAVSAEAARAVRA